MSQITWFILAFIIAVLLNLYVMRIWRRYRRIKEAYQKTGKPISRRELWKQTIITERYRLFFTTLRERTLDSERFRKSVLTVLELTLIALWSIYVGKEYLNFDPRIVPAGREFGSSIQAHHLWTRFQSCGDCALWDGSERGGFPAFVDPLASALHPFVMVTTLLLGVVNGAKVMVIVSLWIAGIAQWWLSRVLGLGRLSRLWGSAMVVVAGHLAGRMELGIISLILSTAMVSMTFAPTIELSKTGSKRSAVALAVVLSLVAVSGQGYMQIGFLVMLPAYLVLIVKSQVGSWLLVKRYLTAAGLGFLLAAPFLIPFIHFWPNFYKDSDPDLVAGQHLSYYLLNLFIDDRDFFYNTSLGKLPYPNMYVMFVGWFPIILALLCIWTSKKQDYRPLSYLSVSAALALFVGSTLPLQWLQPVFPGVAALRFITMIGGLAVPAIIGLAAYSLDKLIKLSWPRLTVILVGEMTPRYKGISSNLILLVPMVFALQSTYDFSQFWLFTERLGDGVSQLVEGLETPDLQWVQTPYGEHFYIEPAVRMGLKLSPGIMTWRWKEREFPVASIEAHRPGPPDESVTQINEIDGVPIYRRPDQFYAAVYSQGSQEACRAYGTGGQIDVFCDTNMPGKLVVKENTWNGWNVWLDGERAPLVGMQWLEVDAPAGKHTYQFRYQPWDVPLGIFLFLVGAILCTYFWRVTPKVIGQDRK